MVNLINENKVFFKSSPEIIEFILKTTKDKNVYY